MPLIVSAAPPVPRPVGDLLDQLGVAGALSAGDAVRSAVAVLEVVTAAGDVDVRLAPSAALSWPDQLGLLTAGRDSVRP